MWELIVVNFVLFAHLWSTLKTIIKTSAKIRNSARRLTAVQMNALEPEVAITFVAPPAIVVKSPSVKRPKAENIPKIEPKKGKTASNLVFCANAITANMIWAADNTTKTKASTSRIHRRFNPMFLFIYDSSSFALVGAAQSQAIMLVIMLVVGVVAVAWITENSSAVKSSGSG